MYGNGLRIIGSIRGMSIGGWPWLSLKSIGSHFGSFNVSAASDTESAILISLENAPRTGCNSTVHSERLLPAK